MRHALCLWPSMSTAILASLSLENLGRVKRSTRICSCNLGLQVRRVDKRGVALSLAGAIASQEIWSIDFTLPVCAAIGIVRRVGRSLSAIYSLVIHDCAR
jgi:predicted Kef-type K+ transport protein